MGDWWGGGGGGDTNIHDPFSCLASTLLHADTGLFGGCNTGLFGGCNADTVRWFAGR